MIITIIYMSILSISISIIIGIISYFILIYERKRLKNMTLNKGDKVFYYTTNIIYGEVLSEDDNNNVKIEVIISKHVLYKKCNFNS